MDEEYITQIKALPSKVIFYLQIYFNLLILTLSTRTLIFISL